MLWLCTTVRTNDCSVAQSENRLSFCGELSSAPTPLAAAAVAEYIGSTGPFDDHGIAIAAACSKGDLAQIPSVQPGSFVAVWPGSSPSFSPAPAPAPPHAAPKEPPATRRDRLLSRHAALSPLQAVHFRLPPRILLEASTRVEGSVLWLVLVSCGRAQRRFVLADTCGSASARRLAVPAGGGGGQCVGRREDARDAERSSNVGAASKRRVFVKIQ